MPTLKEKADKLVESIRASRAEGKPLSREALATLARAQEYAPQNILTSADDPGCADEDCPFDHAYLLWIISPSKQWRLCGVFDSRNGGLAFAEAMGWQNPMVLRHDIRGVVA